MANATTAEELAAYEKLDARVTLLTWVVGTVTALQLGTLWLAYNIVARLPR